MKQKIKITKLKMSSMEWLNQALLFYKTEYNNKLANQNLDPNCEVIHGLASKIWHEIDARINKDYPPLTFSLNLPIHEARLIFNAIITYQVCLDLPLNSELEMLKLAVHQQLTDNNYNYEEFTYSIPEDPATSHPLIQIQNQRDPIRIGKSSTT